MGVLSQLRLRERLIRALLPLLLRDSHVQPLTIFPLVPRFPRYVLGPANFFWALLPLREPLLRRLGLTPSLRSGNLGTLRTSTLRETLLRQLGLASTLRRARPS